MKILNIKIDIHKILWISVIVILFIFLLYLIFCNNTIRMNTSNYTQILKDSHENTNKYIGKRITTTGYIFIGEKFSKNHFVVARDMLISENEVNIVGFLCEYSDISNFDRNEWVEVTGTIVLGDYFGPIPIIKVENIRRITTPNDIYVKPPA